MNTIIITSQIVDEINSKCDGYILSQLVIDKFIFPEVKLCIQNESKENYLVFKVKFIQGTRHFECKAFGSETGFRFNVGFIMQYEEKHKRFAFNSLRENDLYAYDYLIGANASDQRRREYWQKTNVGTWEHSPSTLLQHYEL